MTDPDLLNGRYRLVQKLAAGGMGSVWLAEDQLLERSVALKALVQHHDPGGLEERRRRAVQEGRAMARVRHPAIVPIHDLFYVGQDPWIVMEYVSGRSLAAIISRDEPLEERALAAIGLPVLRGLSAVHRVGVVHRDVKPANILVAYDNSVFLVDFGIAKIAGDMSLTSQHNIIGTLEFLAPERLRCEEVGPMADFWSLGVTLLYALEGYSPFRRGSEHATIAAILNDDPPRPAKPGRLADIALKLLRKDPARRPHADEIGHVLQEIAGGAPTNGSVLASQTEPTPKSSRPMPVGNAREMIKMVGPDTAVDMLLAMPEDHAAQILASYSPPLCADLLGGVAAARPGTAGEILQMLSVSGASRALGYLGPETGASILATMSPGAAAQILDYTNERTAAGMLMALPVRFAARLTKAMDARRAADALLHVRPATVAALLDAEPDLYGTVLQQLTPSFREQVMRHLGGTRKRQKADIQIQ